MDKTWVSYVYCNRLSGKSGTRSRANIRTEPYPMLYQRNPDIKIMDTDLSYEQAANYLSLTPEICRFTYELDTLFSENNKFRRNNFDFAIKLLLSACKRIVEDRVDRKKHHLTPLDNYLEYYVDVNAGDNEKYQLFRKLPDLFKIRPDGSIVDLKAAFFTLLSPFLDNQFKAWEKD